MLEENQDNQRKASPSPFIVFGGCGIPANMSLALYSLKSPQCTRCSSRVDPNLIFMVLIVDCPLICSIPRCNESLLVTPAYPTYTLVALTSPKMGTVSYLVLPSRVYPIELSKPPGRTFCLIVKRTGTSSVSVGEIFAERVTSGLLL